MTNKLTSGSWKTSGAGIAAILIAGGAALKALTDGDDATSIDFAALIAAVVAGLGLICARDNNRSSEQVGAK